MKKLLIALILVCILFTACGKKNEEANSDGEGTSYSQLLSTTYSFDSDFGDMLVRLMNTTSIKQKIGIEPEDTGKITVERVKDMEKAAEDGRYNNVIRITVDAGDKALSEKLFNTFYDKAEKGIASIVKDNKVTIEKVD